MWLAGPNSRVPGSETPMDMALAPNDVIYVVNRSYESRADGTRINVFRLGDQGEEYITEFGSYGEGKGQFIWPISIAVDSDVNVYVADEWLHRINVYDPEGEFLRDWGRHGTADGELNRPSGLAVGKDGTLYVVDSLNHRVQRFTLDGEYLGQFGSFGSGPGQLNTPWGIGLDRDGNVFVADWRNDRIQQFTPQGEWQASFGQPGTGGDASIAREMGGIKVADVPVGQFNRPAGVCVDQDGDIYVADWLNKPGPGFDPGRPLYQRVHRRCRTVQVGCGQNQVQPGHDPSAQRRARLYPRAGAVGALRGEGGRQWPDHHSGHDPPPVPGVPEEHRARPELSLHPWETPCVHALCWRRRTLPEKVQ